MSAAAAPALSGCLRRSSVRVAAPAPPELITGPGSLKTHAAVHGFLYGCAVNTQLLANDEAYAALVREQANIVVAENAMKWEAMRPAIDQYDFAAADALVAFAEQNRMKVRGHNLCWHRQLPAWFAGEATTGNARGLLMEHIERVAGRYAGRMHSWDVVNEAVLVSDGRADGLRDSPWLRLVGVDYIEAAFSAARNADPQALLAYNDYGIEGEDDASAKKRAAVLVLLRRLKARHVPVDAVGIQSHIMAGHAYGAGLVEFMVAARELGLQIFVSELDVNDREWPENDEVRDTAVAETYGSYLGVTLREPAVRVVMTWGITDRSTWLDWEDARPDHAPERCLPFDAEGKPKKAFFAMRTSFDRNLV